ncbi:MAG: hypothetical protein Phyf2KO_24290 [Phycisphaerales bacterium]
MDKKPEPPPAEDDSPGRPMPGVPAADAPTAELTDPGSLLSSDDLTALGAHTERFMALLAQESIRGDIRVKVIDDTEMSRQHEEHKNTPGTTDVLTFDLAPDNDTLLDADILICADEARRQSDERGHGVVSELMLYIVHSVLHCTGFDDAAEDGAFGANAMHAREDEILTQLGLGAVFHTQNAGDAS